MKKRYTKPDLEIIELGCSDVIITSNGTDVGIQNDKNEEGYLIKE